MAEESEYARMSGIPVLTIDAEAVVPGELLKEIHDAESVRREAQAAGWIDESNAAPERGAGDAGGEPLSRRARGW